MVWTTLSIRPLSNPTPILAKFVRGVGVILIQLYNQTDDPQNEEFVRYVLTPWPPHCGVWNQVSLWMLNTEDLLENDLISVYAVKDRKEAYE